MKPKFRSFLYATTAFVAVSHTYAATGVWIQTGVGPFDWGTAGNWSGSTIANGVDFTASFSSNITANQTINLDTARTIGNIVASDGSHDFTISGANVLTLDTTNPALSSINVTPYARSLTISSVIDGNDGLRKIGAGSLILNGAAVNTFTGGVDVTSGTLNLNFANLATPANLVDSSNVLKLGGGSLLIAGNSATDTSQTLGNVTVNAGGGQILVNPNGASRTATLTLGSITPFTSTSTLLIGKASGAAGTATITTTSGTLTNGIYGGHMVYFNGTANTGYDWATTATAGPGPYAVSGLGSYTTLPTSGGSSAVNYNMTAATTLTGGFSVNTLKMSPGATASVILNLGGNTLTVEGGGLLFTGSGTGNVISNGNVTAGAGSNYSLFVHSYNSQFNNTGASNPGISAAITNNGSNAVALVVTGNPGSATAGGTTGLFSLSNTGNSFTGGIYLNNAAVQLGGGAGAINGNTIYASGYSVLYNPTFTTTSAIQLADGAMLDFRNNVTAFTTTGAVTGKGGIVLGQAGGGETPLNLNSTGNTFSGPVEMRNTPNTRGSYLTVNSIGDADVLGSGDISFGVAGVTGTGVNEHRLNIGPGAVAPITFNNRRIELAGTNNSLPVINNNSSQALTINTDLVFSGGSSKLLNLGGTGAGTSTFAGDIGDSPNPTTGATILGATYATGATTITLGSVNGISLGASITGPNIPAATTVTAINPVTKQVTLSAATTGAGTAGASVTATGVIGNLSLTKTGSSVWTLSGNNSFSGGLTLSGASVGSQLNINSATALGTGTFTISGGNNAKIDSTGGNVANSNNNAMIWSNDFAFVGTNNLDLGTGAVTLGGSRAITVSAKTLTVGGNISGSGAFSLTKNGSGKLVLGGTNAYTGATIVNAGTMEIALGGSTQAASAVAVNNSASLIVNGTVGGTLNASSSTTVSGSGTVTGAATVSGALNPGNSPGILTFGNSLAMASTTATTIEISGLNRGTDYDGVNVGTILGYDGSMTLAVGTTFGAGNYTFNIFDAFTSQSGDLISVALTGSYTSPLVNTLGVWSTTTNSGNETWTFTQSTGDLTLAVVPEPSSMALLSSLGAILLLRRRR